jgi:hypothetical protein
MSGLSRSIGGLNKIKPTGFDGASPPLTSTPQPTTSLASTAPEASTTPSASGQQCLPAMSINSPASSPAIQGDLRITPLSATEDAWLTELYSRVGHPDASVPEYNPEVIGRLNTLILRFEQQSQISDTDLAMMIDELCAYLNCATPTPKALSHYFKEMCEWPAVVVEQAFIKARQNWRFPKFPLIADFQRFVDFDIKDRATTLRELKTAARRMKLGKREYQANKEREARAAALTAKALAKLAKQDPGEREEAIRKTCPPDVADRLIARIDEQA